MGVPMSRWAKASLQAGSRPAPNNIVSAHMYSCVAPVSLQNLLKKHTVIDRRQSMTDFTAKFPSPGAFPELDEGRDCWSEAVSCFTWNSLELVGTISKVRCICIYICNIHCLPHLHCIIVCHTLAVWFTICLHIQIPMILLNTTKQHQTIATPE